jgi:hypothetical protein
MMRSSRVLAISSTRALLNGITFPTGGTDSAMVESTNTLPVNERGVKSSSQFPEPNTAVYDAAIISWTYFEPMKVTVDKLPAPEAKYYQKNTKRPWDISSTEWVEIQYRKKFFMSVYYFTLLCLVFFYFPKEKSYSGLRGADGWYVMLPKNQSELFA